MSKLWTPFDAERDAVVERGLQRGIFLSKQLDRELKRLDPYLDVVFIGEKAPEYPGLVPGRWHVRRRNMDELDTYLPIAGPNNEYVEPGMWLVDAMKERDLWNGASIRELMQRQVRAAEDRKKKLETDREALRDDAAAIVRAARRVSGEGGMTKRRWGAK